MPEARAVADLPTDIDALLALDAAEGQKLVARLVDEWRDGTNRFDLPGEALVEVRCAGGLCAVGGLNVDPYLRDSNVGRIRHVYVDPGRRRTGVGRLLIETLIGLADGHFERVRLRSVREGGPRFYESLGFTPTTEPEATHHMWLRGHTPAR